GAARRDVERAGGNAGQRQAVGLVQLERAVDGRLEEADLRLQVDGAGSHRQAGGDQVRVAVGVRDVAEDLAVDQQRVALRLVDRAAGGERDLAQVGARIEIIHQDVAARLQRDEVFAGSEVLDVDRAGG